MVSSPSAPPAPDPAATARAQGAMNKETAVAQSRLNMVDQYSPYGSAVFTEIPGSDVDGVPRYRQDVTLSPEQQARFDIEQQLATDMAQLGQGQVGRIESAVSQPFSYDGMPAAPVADEAARQQVQDALYQRQAQYLDPQFEDERRRQETDLVNRGFSVGSEAYTRAMDDFDRRRRSAYADARSAAITGGGAEQSRLFGLQGAARERAIQEAMALRNQPINEMAALLGTGPGVQVPQFSPTPGAGIAAPDYQGAVAQNYAGDMNQYNQRMGARNAMMGALFGTAGNLGGAWIASDRRLKTNIRRIGTLSNGLGFYAYRYVWGGPEQVGVMAQEVAKVIPEAVRSFGGWLAVDYAKLEA